MNTSDVEDQLQRIIISRPFRASKRMRRFLEFTVRQVMEGKSGELKEALVGVEVFDRPADYDPRIDPIVRVEARRLRQKIEQYYASEGARDPVRIEYVKGGYAPVIAQAARETADLPAASLGTIRSVLVLPFVSLGAGTDQEYFSDGLTQELIHAFTRVSGLRVLAWNTSARLRGKSAQAPDVNEQAQADVIVEGSVRRQGDRVRVHVQIVEAKSDFYLWTETFERTLGDLFALQEQIARSIASVLRIQLTAPTAPRPNYRVEAHDFYLRGRHEWFRRTEQSLRQSIVLFERAIKEDERCAPAWAGLADACSLLADYGFEPTATVIEEGRPAVMRALELDPSLAEAHTSLGFIKSFFDWDWGAAEQCYRTAIALNPGYVTAHHWYGLDLLALQGRFDEARVELDIAARLDPLEPIILESGPYLSLLCGDFAAAEAGYRKLIASAPQFTKGYTGCGRSLWGMGRYAEAIEMLEMGRSLSGDVPSVLGALGQVYATAGNEPEARRYLAMLYEMSKTRHVPTSCLALVHSGLGEREAALGHLERGVERRELPLNHMKVHPGYDALRGEERFQRLLVKMRLVG
ncbi:MAG TPA: tetratricopeptide repeat protein [Bryobacteraceae bacterium]|nr:tetratricopeptide repeat protein [Bryobacteraceae bacterium]